MAGNQKEKRVGGKVRPGSLAISRYPGRFALPATNPANPLKTISEYFSNACDHLSRRPPHTVRTLHGLTAATFWI
jgi:hypothetical protein